MQAGGHLARARERGVVAEVGVAVVDGDEVAEGDGAARFDEDQLALAEVEVAEGGVGIAAVVEEAGPVAAHGGVDVEVFVFGRLEAVVVARRDVGAEGVAFADGAAVAAFDGRFVVDAAFGVHFTDV